jgi:hypothetical protein
VGARPGAQEHTVNIFAFSMPRVPDWRWRIVDAEGAILEESSTTFESIAQAMVAGRECLQLHLDRERPAPARVPWHRRH